MLGVVIESGQVRLRQDLPLPAPAPGEVRVEVLQVGLCATDLALARGYMDFHGVPGHEFVGRALEGSLAGQRVVGEINAPCGQCPSCRAGLGRHCPHRTVLGIQGRPGALAEQLILPEQCLHRVPDDVSSDAAIFTEPLAAAFEIVEQVRPRPGQRALVAGDGRLGLLCAQVLALEGLRVTVAGPHPERAALLPEGIEHRTGILEPPPGPGPYDLAVEATGDPAALQPLLALVRPRGTIVLKTTSERPATLDLAPAVVNELVLVGSRCGVFPPALRALAGGQVQVEQMIEARYPLRQAPEALEHAGRGDVLKVVVQMT